MIKFHWMLYPQEQKEFFQQMLIALTEKEFNLKNITFNDEPVIHPLSYLSRFYGETK